MTTTLTKDQITASAAVTGDNGKRLSKEAWIEAAADLLRPYMPDGTRDYAETLYDTYVVDHDNPDCTPEFAVNEDRSYWG